MAGAKIKPDNLSMNLPAARREEILAAELARNVEAMGWREGLGESLRSLELVDKSLFVRGIEMAAQTAWAFWAGRTPADVVINFDGDFGTTTVALGHLFKRVVGVFKTRAEARCALLRARAEGLENVSVAVAATIETLPLKPSGFDLATMSRLDLWFRSGTTRNADVRALADIVADEGSCFVVGQRSHLLKRPSDNDPRRLQRDLVPDGFRVRETVVLHPSWRSISYVAARSVLGGGLIESLKEGVKRKSLGIALVRDGSFRDAGGLACDIATTIASEDGGAVGALQSIDVGTGSGLVLKFDRYIARFAVSDESAALYRQNFEALTQLQAHPEFLAPKPLMSGTLGTRRYFVENKMPGKEPRKGAGDKLATRIHSYCSLLHNSTAGVFRIDEPTFARLFQTPILVLKGHLMDDMQPRLDSCLVSLREHFLDKEVRLARIHGDFKRTNFLVDPSGALTGVIDWDQSRAADLPLIDVLFFKAYETALDTGAYFETAVADLALSSTSKTDAWISEYLAASPAGGEPVLEASGLMTLVHRIRAHVPPTLQRDPWLARSHLMAPLKRAVDFFAKS